LAVLLLHDKKFYKHQLVKTGKLRIQIPWQGQFDTATLAALISALLREQEELGVQF
jgi:hypothetical protein